MSSSLEKVFFNYILNNRKFFEIVQPYFFRNAEIQFIYGIIRNYMIKNVDAKTPSPRQILDMILLEDKDGNITKEILKSVLQVNLGEYDEKNFIEPKFNAWVLTNRLKTGTIDIIDETREFDSITDFDKAIEAAGRIRSIVDEMSSTSFVEDDDIGSDFDDPEHHLQDTSKFKVKSGFDTIDHMLGGGWDIQTLNVVMAETNNGKCSFASTKCHIKNKVSYNIVDVEIGKMFSKISKWKQIQMNNILND